MFSFGHLESLKYTLLSKRGSWCQSSHSIEWLKMTFENWWPSTQAVFTPQWTWAYQKGKPKCLRCLKARNRTREEVKTLVGTEQRTNNLNVLPQAFPYYFRFKKIVIACKPLEYEKHWNLVYLKAPRFGKNKNKWID